MLSIRVFGTPVSQLRMRHSGNRVYEPKKSADWKHYCHLSFKVAMHKDGHKPFDPGIPLECSVVFYMPRPKSNKNPSPIVKPDVSNLVKLVEDAANGVIWHDDSAIVYLTASKQWASVSEPPGFLIRVSEMQLTALI